MNRAYRRKREAVQVVYFPTKSATYIALFTDATFHFHIRILFRCSLIYVDNI